MVCEFPFNGINRFDGNWSHYEITVNERRGKCDQLSIVVVRSLFFELLVYSHPHYFLFVRPVTRLSSHLTHFF